MTDVARLVLRRGVAFYTVSRVTLCVGVYVCACGVLHACGVLLGVACVVLCVRA